MPDFQSYLAPFVSPTPLHVEIKCTGNILQGQQIELCYDVTGSVDQIIFDPLLPNGKRSDDLWKKTCFEIFVKDINSESYWEYNLAPSSNWATYGFSAYRKGKFDELSIANVPIKTSILSNQFTLQGTIPLPKPLFDQKLKIGLSTVIQDRKGDIYYYALLHTNESPDFHDERSFTISTDL
jgi:hypothetical protein